MPRLRRYPNHRYLGTRDDMVVYDCDDEEEFAALSRRVDEEGLIGRGMVSSFGPDTIAEARNRGFSPR
jgi:hypothetical protein